MNAEARYSQYEDDTIDLRAYLLVLVKYRWLILGVAVLAAVIAGAISLSAARVYEAKVGVVITQSRAELSLEPRFMTVSEEGSDARAHRATLTGLVKNAAIASEVVARLGDQLPDALRDVARLMNMVEAGNTQTGLIEITVQASSPVTAALVANTWGAEYEKHVNQLYGGAAGESMGVIAEQAQKAKTEYEVAQQALVDFTAKNRVDELTRLIEEKQQVIAGLQIGKQTAITSTIKEILSVRQEIVSAYVNAQAQNRLLAFEKEQEAKRALMATLIDAEANARLAAVEKDREARSKLFTQYVNAQINNRLAALSKEQQAKTGIFSAYADADSRAKIAVFNRQLEAKLETLASYYTTTLKLESLLQDAKALQEQARRGGASSSATNSLAILLLKAEAYASSTDLPGQLQLQLGSAGELDAGAAGQIADLEALIGVLEARINDLDALIAEQSRELFDNEGYDLLTAERPEDDPLFAALRRKYAELFEVGALASAADEAWQESELAQAIRAKYEELFGLGPMAEASCVISPSTPIFVAIQARYPDLFALGDLAELAQEASVENPLATASVQMTEELLRLKDLEMLPSYAAGAATLNQAINALEEEVRGLRAQLEAEQATEQELVRARDLALETYDTVARKAAEVDVSSAVMGTVVRFASPAVEPRQPVPAKMLQKVLLAGAAGFVLAAGTAFLISYLYPGFDPAMAVRRRPRRGAA